MKIQGYIYTNFTMDFKKGKRLDATQIEFVDGETGNGEDRKKQNRITKQYFNYTDRVVLFLGHLQTEFMERVGIGDMGGLSEILHMKFLYFRRLGFHDGVLLFDRNESPKCITDLVHALLALGMPISRDIPSCEYGLRLIKDEEVPRPRSMWRDLVPPSYQAFFGTPIVQSCDWKFGESDILPRRKWNDSDAVLYKEATKQKNWDSYDTIGHHYENHGPVYRDPAPSKGAALLSVCIFFTKSNSRSDKSNARLALYRSLCERINRTCSDHLKILASMIFRRLMPQNPEMLIVQQDLKQLSTKEDDETEFPKPAAGHDTTIQRFSDLVTCVLCRRAPSFVALDCGHYSLCHVCFERATHRTEENMLTVVCSVCGEPSIL